ncbi:ABC transporter ATP-binding protein [Georgenia subflava]|uniref:ATP-binding cassette domain-containing protein n=1 Tax=Georgenia subflava TaxID=1622177 RepID=A0A6N7EKK5_9MICO|nr:ABC transporter ATP-binding protein [Georgenia subflava]MPV35804.1 ATP-binding cassette domain-containing protein [Georgenia subflava]
MPLPHDAVPTAGAARGAEPAGATTAGTALAVRGLRKSYGNREVVRELSLTARRGELTAVLGPNGAGKTTTIECCEGLRRPDGGTIEVLGLDRAARGADAELRERVGVMLQDGGLPMAPRAGAVLGHLARLHADPLDPTALLARLGLSDVAGTRVRQLSGGQRQRLALAGAVVGRPELVFLDEPSAGLDPQSRLAVWELLRELRSAGTSLVLTTHLMTEAEELADHVVIIDAGRVIAEGSPAELTGGTQVRVSPAPAGSVAEVGDALATVLAGHRTLTVRTGPEWVEVSTADAGGRGLDAGTLAVVASALAATGHGDADVSWHRRTLEDTFLDLTGRALREAEEPS